MKTKLYSLSLAGLLGVAAGYPAPAPACGLPQFSLDALAEQALSENQTISTAAITQLRAKGPEGLDALLKLSASIEAQPQSQPGGGLEQFAPWAPERRVTPGAVSLRQTQLRRALDAVGGQCDCYASRLYWYTDLERAKAAAKASGKPILSLRLLGKLNEEYSCANSRFFRTTLYPNADVSKYLREHFILHWQSVRPVPKITIDFGDGRRIERTITGNSAHYILDPDGELVDALPGLYGPKAFLRELTNSEQAALSCSGLSPQQKRRYLAQYHSEGLSATVKAWNADLARLGERPMPLPVANISVTAKGAPTAKMAGELAISKRAIEAPLLKSSQPPGEAPSPGRAALSDELWARIAALHESEARLDTRAFRLIASKLPTASEASTTAFSKSLVETPALRTLRNLQRSIAEDTVRNEYLLHARIHKWFVQSEAPANLDAFNAKVYMELFLMPQSDPWLGLAPANVFTALPNEGLMPAVSPELGGATALSRN